MLARSLPYWPVNPLLSTSPWFTFQIDLVRVPVGHSAGHAAVGRELSAGAGGGGVARTRIPGRLVGGIYAANTVGAIVGALAFSLVLIPWIGTGGCERAADRAGGGRAPLVVLVPVVHAQRSLLGAALAGGGRWWRPVYLAVTVRAGAADADRLRAPHHDLRQPLEDALLGRRHQLLHRHLAVGRRRRAVPRQRQGGSLHRALRHAAAAHAGAPAGADPSQPAIGAGGGLRRGRHGGNLRGASGGEAHRDLRNGAADSAHRHALLRQGELRRDARSAHADRLRRRAPLRAHHAARSSTSSPPTPSIRG